MLTNYVKIFRQAWALAKTHKFLWAFGLFLILGNLANGGLSFIGQEKLVTFSKQLSANWLILTSVLLVFLSLIYFQAQAGMIASLKAILDKKETSFGQGFRVGRLFLWRLLGAAVVMNVGLFILSFIIWAPISYLYFLNLFWQATILSILGLVILIPIAILIALMNIMAPMFIVLYDLTITEAIHRSFDLVREFWFKLLVLGFLLFVIVLAGLAVSLFVFLVYFAYYRGGLELNFGLMVCLAVVGSIIFLVVQALVLSFQQIVWVLVFLELVKPQKLEEEKPLAVPEIV